jgi:hypothetical protein
MILHGRRTRSEHDGEVELVEVVPVASLVTESTPLLREIDRGIGQEIASILDVRGTQVQVGVEGAVPEAMVVSVDGLG